ncbi:MAG: TRAP transporter fused permease subunit, partial [Rhodospirillaceae bacterium]
MIAENPEADGTAVLRPETVVARLLGAAFVVVAILWAFQVPGLLGLSLFNEQFLVICLGLAASAVYLSIGANRQRQIRAPFYDWAAAIVFFAISVYVAWNYSRFLQDAPYDTDEMFVIGLITVVLVMEGMRRVAGTFLFVVVLVFIAYGLLAHQVPAPLTGAETGYRQLANYLAFDTNALLGTPLVVATTIVVLFIFLGQTLFVSGGGEFFTDIAMATMGHRRGGAAKISVVASALFGSISGSAISNVTTTGVITIPLMKRSGYSAVDSGAIEANASTGGQFMPPIMGAAAFLMAEFLQISYTDVMIAALVPALLYYFAIFVQVDLVAARDNISVVKAALPDWRRVLADGWQFILPFVILLVALFHLKSAPEIAALYAAASILVLGAIRAYKGARINLRTFCSSFWSAGLATTELVMIVAAAGFVIGILNKTGGGFALTQYLVSLGGGNLFVLLFVGGIVCIVLGMGMPTSGVYVLLAFLVAPGLIEAGVDKIPAHLFILYFGMMSMITPPIALAAFAAASLSRADPMRTGFAAMRMGWVAYVIPFLFVFSPTLVMQGEADRIIVNTVTAVIGVYLISVAMTGYFTRPFAPAMRILLAVTGAAALVP